MVRPDESRRERAGRIRRARERRLVGELADALAEAHRRDDWRASLVSALGHDVRSPLAAVVSMAELLQTYDEVLGPQRRAELLQGILRQAQRALTLADDLLDLARLDEGEFVLRPEQIGLEHLVGRTVLGHGQDVRVAIPASLVLTCDPGRISQVVANLVDNARRHGRPPIDVTARRDAGIVTVEVRDAGEGVPDDVIDRLFTRFGAGDHPESTGLGLWLSAQIVEAHGGVIAYEHRDPGAAFVVTLPDDPRRGSSTAD